MPSPRIALALAALAASLVTVAPASADDSAAQTRAIAACRTAVASQFGVAAEDLNLDRIDTRGRTINVRLAGRKDGGRIAAECTYARRGGETQVAVLAGAPSATAPAR